MTVPLTYSQIYSCNVCKILSAFQLPNASSPATDSRNAQVGLGPMNPKMNKILCFQTGKQ